MSSKSRLASGWYLAGYRVYANDEEYVFPVANILEAYALFNKSYKSYRKLKWVYRRPKMTESDKKKIAELNKDLQKEAADWLRQHP